MATHNDLLKQVQKLNEEKKYQDVIDLLTDEVLANLNNADLYAQRAQALFFVEKFNEALNDANTALSINPSLSNAHNTLGLIAHKKDEFDKAKSHFEKAIELNHNYADPFNNLGFIFIERKEYNVAIHYLLIAIDLNPTFSEAFNNLGVAFHKIKRFDKAINFLNEAITLKTNFAFAYNNRGNVYRDLREYDRALNDYNKAIELDGKYVIAYTNRASLLSDYGKFEEAIKDYNTAINIAPNYSYAYLSKGRTLLAKGEYNEAYNNIEKSLALDPANNESLYWLDRVKALLGEKIDLKENPRDTYELFINATRGLKEKERKQIYQKANAIMKGSLSGIRKLTCEVTNTNLVHYTKLKVANIFASDDKKLLRYYNAVNMNDPEEGKILLKCFQNKEIEHSFYLGQSEEESNIYLGSFLPVEFDDVLVLWRTYGKDENKIEASGCSIEIDHNFFDKEAKTINTELGEYGAISEPNHALYRVLYYNKRENAFTGENADDIKKAVKQLEKELTELLDLKSPKPTKKNTAIDKIIYHIISELRYFVKSSDYSFENELRVIQLASYRDPKVMIDEDRGLPQPLYVESKLPILPHIRSITLGPKVPHPEQWIFLEAKAQKKGFDIKVKRSNVKFQ